MAPPRAPVRGTKSPAQRPAYLRNVVEFCYAKDITLFERKFIRHHLDRIRT